MYRLAKKNHWPRLRFTQAGFTLIETLVIIVVVGVVVAIAAPNLTSMMERIKVDQNVAAVRGVLQSAQREAIRNGQSCITAMSLKKSSGLAKGHNKKYCSSATSYSPPVDTDLVTNITNPSDAKAVPGESFEIEFGILGNAKFGIYRSSSTPTDPSGKIVAFVSQNDNVPKKCIAISNTLGLTRVGTYIGDLAPTSITQTGVCTALNWKDQ